MSSSRFPFVSSIASGLLVMFHLGCAGDSQDARGTTTDVYRTEPLGENGGSAGTGGEGIDAGAVCYGCLVDGVCHVMGALDPDNPCRICRPYVDRFGFDANDGADCDDGSYCTDGDTCRAGRCLGLLRRCEDDVACNGVEACDEIGERCVAGVSECGAGTSCDRVADRCLPDCAGCVIAGVCYAEGEVDRFDVCRVCDPARALTAWSRVAHPPENAGCG